MKYNITINGEIGWWPNTGRIVGDEVRNLKGKPCSVYLSSPGGNVVDALEIYQAFKEHGDVTVHIFGFTASAATLLAMGAKTIEMSQNALMLIHKASVFQDFWGSMNTDQLDDAIKELEKSKDTLNKIDEIIANIYALRAGGTKDTFLAKMKKAEWLRASDVKDLGLIDSVMADAKVENMVLTNSVKDALEAQKLPLPDESLLRTDSAQLRTDDRPSFADRVKSLLTQWGFTPKDEKTKEEAPQNAASQNEPKDVKIMNKDFACINAALGVEGVTASEDGKVTLSIEEMKKINDAIENAKNSATTAQNSANEKDQKIAELNTEIENLKKADGDETPKNEGGKAPEDENRLTGAMAEFEGIKDYL